VTRFFHLQYSFTTLAGALHSHDAQTNSAQQVAVWFYQFQWKLS